MNWQDYIEFIQVELSHARHSLGITEDIIVITDGERWSEITHDEEEEWEGSYGVADGYERYIFINMEEIDTLRRLKENIWHELLHFKYPRKSERSIRKITKKTIGWNTYGHYGDHDSKNDGMGKNEN